MPRSIGTDWRLLAYIRPAPRATTYKASNRKFLRQERVLNRECTKK